MMEGTELIKGTISRHAIILDGWDGQESDEIEVKDTMNDNEGLIQKRSVQSFRKRTEELANEDKQTCGTEDKTTNRNKGEKDKEKDTMDGTEELDDDEEQETMEGNKEPIEIHDPEISGYSFFGVGGSKNKNQKDRTNIIKRSSMEAIEKEENGSINEESVEEDDKDDDDQEDKEDNDEEVDDDVGEYYNGTSGSRDTSEPIIVQEKYEYKFVFVTKMLVQSKHGRTQELYSDQRHHHRSE